jgi:RHS repeat-associated protein
VPDENPSGLGAFEFPLRFPGQYADRESNLSYNMARDYSPELGRYVESDPVGLVGGLNTYLHVNADPLRNKDPLGLAALCTLAAPDRGKCEAKLFLDMAICEGIEAVCIGGCAFSCRWAGPFRARCMSLCVGGICDPVAGYCRKGAATDYADCKKREAGA